MPDRGERDAPPARLLHLLQCRGQRLPVADGGDLDSRVGEDLLVVVERERVGVDGHAVVPVVDRSGGHQVRFDLGDVEASSSTGAGHRPRPTSRRPGCPGPGWRGAVPGCAPSSNLLVRSAVSWLVRSMRTPAEAPQLSTAFAQAESAPSWGQGSQRVMDLRSSGFPDEVGSVGHAVDDTAMASAGTPTARLRFIVIPAKPVDQRSRWERVRWRRCAAPGSGHEPGAA